MKKLLLSVVMFLAVATLLTSCTKNAQGKDVTNTITLPANGNAVVDANNRFAFAFLQSALQQDSSTKTNKLISPLSIYMALSMVYNGADNATKDSMANALQLQGIDINNLNATCKALIQQLPKEDNQVQFTIANSIWYNTTGAQPLQSFLDINNSYFNATVQGLNFGDGGSVNTINNWVSSNTQGKIPTVLNKTSASDLMYLINAIYFKGAWQQSFSTANTKNSSFYLQDGTIASVPFMQQEIATNVFTNSQMRVVELPYGGGNSYSMYIADAGSSTESTPLNVNEFAATLTASNLKAAIASMQKTFISLSLPKWEYKYSIDDFLPELKALGMGIAMSDNADFSKMYSQSVAISKAIHKTYIKVDEQGTTAAAVTAIGVTATAVPMNIFAFNHPFVYVIAEKQTGSILFTGVMNDPSK